MKLIQLKEIDSTNTYAFEQLKSQGVDAWTVFVAESQQAGKGQRNNSWESEAGKNLTFSVVLRPDFLPAMQQFFLSIVVCLGIEKTLSKYLKDIAIKWPNDIYVGDKKICGILIENQLSGMNLRSAIVGVGLNVNQTNFVSNAPNPVSIKQITGKDLPLPTLLQELVGQIKYFYKELEMGNLPLLSRLFKERMYRIGKWHNFMDANGEFEGQIEGVNEIGQLLVKHREDDLCKAYHFKEIQFII